MQGRSRKRFPSQEELELWAHVTRHDEPLARDRPVLNGDGSAAKEETKPTATAPAATTSPSAPEAASAKSVIPARSRPDLPPHAPFDPRLSKRIARGRHPIDARLDLHGLRQQDAYVILRRFLARCQADGLRHVLVITGKGGGTDDVADRDFWRTDERGILRRLVPHWLSEPSFRLHVVSFTELALKHGGSGALYVTIRKGPRHPRS